MFSTVNSLFFRGSFIKVYRCCVQYSPKVLSCLRTRNCSFVLKFKYSSPLVEHPARSLVIASASEHERSASDSEEEVKRRKPKQIQVIEEMVKSTKSITDDEMCKFRNDVLNAGNVINESNIDAVVIGCCFFPKNIEFANAYLSFLERSSSTINVATLGRYMKLCYVCIQIADKRKILQVWHNLKERLPLMDASTAENIIHGLSVTSEWKQGVNLLSTIKETCVPGVSTYSALIIAAFRNGDVDLGWDLLEECIRGGKTQFDAVYCVWLDEFCTISSEARFGSPLEMAEKLLNFFSSHEILMSIEVAKKFKKCFENMKWKGRFTSINERGICQSCRAEMHPIFISQSEFKVLSKTFLEKVLIGPDVFSKSSPEEVKAFQEFIAKNAPYNTVIDGLNVGYSSGVDRKTSRMRPASLLKNVVAHFVDLSHKILVLGRTHMNQWPREEMEYIRENSQLFLTENMSEDDPFLLYAAMSSGPGTCFLSRDLMRGHAYRLKCVEPSLAGVFQRWQLSHQMRLLGAPSVYKVDIKLPLEYSPTVQKIDGKWHIPVQNEEGLDGMVPEERKGSYLTRSHLDPPTTWLCLSPKTTVEKNYSRKFQYPKNRSYERY